MNIEIENSIKNDRKKLPNEVILDYFVTNQRVFDDISYLRQMTKTGDDDFLIYPGKVTKLPRINLGKRYFGNSLLIQCDEEEIRSSKEHQRVIKVNDGFFFLNAMLYVQCFGQTYRLKANEGFLQLYFWQRHTPKIIK